MALRAGLALLLAGLVVAHGACRRAALDLGLLLWALLCSFAPWSLRPGAGLAASLVAGGRGRVAARPLTVALCAGWDYRAGGSDWSEGSCGEGPQSPVDILSAFNVGGADSEELDVHYPVVEAWQQGMKVEHTGNAIEVRLPPRPHPLGPRWSACVSRRVCACRAGLGAQPQHGLCVLHGPEVLRAQHCVQGA